MVKHFLEKFSGSSELISWFRPLLLISKFGLNDEDIESMRGSLCHDLGLDRLSVITSIKMMHIYFRVGSKTFDYRPHRGSRSGLFVQDYRIGRSDRVEMVITLDSLELERFGKYCRAIENSRLQTLGPSYPFTPWDLDYSVREFQTERHLDSNRFLAKGIKHNCLTWFTTAPIGETGNSAYQLLGMSDRDLEMECHSYISTFNQFLLVAAPRTRVPLAVYWSNDRLDLIKAKLVRDPKAILKYLMRETDFKAPHCA